MFFYEMGRFSFCVAKLFEVATLEFYNREVRWEVDVKSGQVMNDFCKISTSRGNVEAWMLDTINHRGS